jgi:hypothetical protein
MKRGIIVITAAFAVALAVVVGNRMSADAMAVVVGVMCGVLASVPTSLLLIWALGRRGQGAAMNSMETQARNGAGMHYPPVVVVNPGPSYGSPAYGPYPMPMDRNLPAPAGPRTFKVVGDEETLLDNAQHIFPGLADEWGDGR